MSSLSSLAVYHGAMTKGKQFVHLHLHTSYSLLDGLCRIGDLMDDVMEADMPAVAITDHGVMYGTIDFYQTARDKGVKPILGSEMYITTGKRTEKGEGPRHPTHHLGLLAVDIAGYHNLVKLSSAAFLEGFYYKPRIDKEILAEHREGLIGLSACLQGEVASHLVSGNMREAVRVAGEYSDIFGKDSFFLELQDHGIPEQRKVNKLLVELAAKTGLSLVATNDVHYLRKEHAPAHEVLLCLQTQTVMSDPDRMRYPTEEFYLKSREEMEQLFGDIPESLDNTLRIAERCNVELEFGKLHFPSYEAPDGLTQKQFLTKLGHEGLKRHYEIADPKHPGDEREKQALARFHTELDVIEKTGYVNYYLVVWDFINFARRADIPVGPGRGSGAGSLLAFVLGITSIDPLQHGLIFERFLNPERVSPPDFDIDFCQARRGKVIEYVKEKYGNDKVAQVITFGSLGAKTVIRDVGRVLEIPYAKCDILSKMVPEDPKMTLKTALEISPEFREAYASDEDCRSILNYGFVLEGLFRNPGTHAAGVVIGERPLTDIVPLALDKEKQPVTQYTMEPLGDIGLLKMDFLGLKTLTVIRETVDLVKECRGKEVDIDNLPTDDEPTYDLLNRGDTIGVFQLESTGMRDLIRRVGIRNIKDLTAMIALYRPGPMNMLDDYVNRKAGRAKTEYDHPLLEPVLNETYGVMLYQEEVMQAANVLAGYSLGEADILRKAMGKKKPEVMQQQRAKFIEGCIKANKIPRAQAERIFETIEKFAGYGFCKAHSTGYAVIAYQTAYLKANFPAEFMSALLSSEIGNFDKLPIFMAEAEEMSLKILPPDVNKSGVRFRPSEGGIRFGLAGIKNVGRGAAESVVEEREKEGPYTGLVDFSCRLAGVSANRKVTESLIRCGAFDSVDGNRAKLFNAIDFATARAASILRDHRSGQRNLFELMDNDEDAPKNEQLPEGEPWPQNTTLAGERELLGVYVSGHPLTEYAALLEKYRLCSIPEAMGLKDRATTRLAGIATHIKKRTTKARKETMAIMSLEDLDTSIEVLIFPEAFREYAAHLVEDAPLLVCGEISRKEESAKLVAQEIYPLPDAPKFFATHLSLLIPAAQIDDHASLDTIKEILRLHPGKVPVRICLQYPSGEKVFLDTDQKHQVWPTHDLIHELHEQLGEQSVYVGVRPAACLKPKKNGRRGKRPVAGVGPNST